MSWLDAQVQPESGKGRSRGQREVTWQVSPEVRDRISRTCRDRFANDPALLAALQDPRRCERIRETLLRLQDDPEFRQRQLQINQSQAKRERNRLSSLRVWNDQIRRAQILAVRQTRHSQLLITPAGITTTNDFRHALMQDPQVQNKQQPWSTTHKILCRLLKNHPDQYRIVKGK
jgi:hypothetical protein